MQIFFLMNSLEKRAAFANGALHLPESIPAIGFRSQGIQGADPGEGGQFSAIEQGDTMSQIFNRCEGLLLSCFDEFEGSSLA